MRQNKILQIGNTDLKKEFVSIPIEDLKLTHVNVSLPCIYEHNMIVYTGEEGEIKLLKNRYGTIGIVNNMTSKKGGD